MEDIDQNYNKNLMKKFAKVIVPKLNEHHLNFIVYNWANRTSQLDEISFFLESNFIFDEIRNLEKGFEKIARNQNKTDKKQFILLGVILFVIYLVHVISELLILNIPDYYFTIPFIFGWIFIMVYHKFVIRKQEYLNFTSLNLVRYSLNKSLINWNSYQDQFHFKS